MASSAPDIEESVSAIIRAFNTDGHRKACIAAHSLGNTFISWMLHHPIACHRVYSTLLVDPVTFLLCDPTVATKVVYKEPSNTLDFLMHFFVARELFIGRCELGFVIINLCIIISNQSSSIIIEINALILYILIIIKH